MRYGGSLRAGRGGTRIRLFAQAPFLARYHVPEVITLSPPAGSVGPGPSDARMYALWPLGKPQPYGEVAGMELARPLLYLPPWEGSIRPAALPDRGGHFDHIPLGTSAFLVAHAYGVIRFTLDVWEGYFGQVLPWHFAREHRRLEISIFEGFDNSRSGYGFLELGSERRPDGSLEEFALNLDVVAHETGHLIVYASVGLPDPVDDTGDYYGFHESAADLVALLTAGHFASVVEEMFEQTRGNINALNRLNRFAELSDHEQIRLACNASRLRDFAAGWSDEHALSLPLTGCMFDILTDLFHAFLIERGLIDRAAAELVDRVEREPGALPVIQALFDRAYPHHAAGYREAFADARDCLGRYLAATWERLRGGPVTYAGIVRGLIEVDREASGGRHQRMIATNAAWRDIGRIPVGPRLAHPAAANGHACSARTLTPQAPLPPLPVRRRARVPRPGQGWRRAAG